MKLNDPFGRMEKRHQLGYEAMREVLRRGGITTPQAARQLIRQARERALRLMAAALVLVLLVAWLLPQALAAALLLLLLLAVWLLNWVVNGRRYINRYIDEEL